MDKVLPVNILPNRAFIEIIGIKRIKRCEKNSFEVFLAKFSRKQLLIEHFQYEWFSHFRFFFPGNLDSNSRMNLVFDSKVGSKYNWFQVGVLPAFDMPLVRSYFP